MFANYLRVRSHAMPVDDIVVRDLIDAQSLAGHVEAVESWPAGSHRWGHYAERTPRGPAICRTENVSACHPAIRELVDGRLRELAGARLGRSAAAFKDKINYKQPGGAGFHPHQDQVAYPGASHVISLLVAIDACTIGSGCLWIAEGVDRVLPTDDRGVVRDDVSSALTWRPVELAPGDVLCIDGMAPHSSEANTSNTQRRVLVASYSPADHNYTRALYYAARAETMSTSTARDQRFRISTLADFAGVEVAPNDAAIDDCTHPPIDDTVRA